ncbi:MAG TPA: non-homologous end-joining DNA ligase [Verrucomicrobiae bacterium]
MSLKEYIGKRDFSATPEPDIAESTSYPGKFRFVIQKHAASRLHYDFRLELGGALKSWAVPKGLPYKKGEKRLAVQVEDHPVTYIDFEGVIPKGQYGAGTVMVWDTGMFEPLSRTPLKDLANGKLHVELHGKKVEGEWFLVRLRDKGQWLLIKGGVGMRPPSKKEENRSVISGLGMEELGKSAKVWKSGARRETDRREQSTEHVEPRKKETVKPHAMSAFIEPMKARLVSEPPEGDWHYEIKFDGFRALAFCRGRKVELYSRNENDLGRKFPEVVKALRQICFDDAILDGEIVALDKKGKSSFQLLQAYEMGSGRPPLAYYVFDVLRFDGEQLLRLTLEERRARLESLKLTEPIRISPSLGDDGDGLLKQARKLGVEGLIGKRSGSFYESGRRSGAWIKLKLQQEQEFVVGGFTEPAGSRKYFGALLLGIQDQRGLAFVGKVGTGFDGRLLRHLYKCFCELDSDKCPFHNLPEKNRQHYGKGITISQMKLCHWLKPEIVCQVRFSEWTRDGSLRQPVFLGLREDKEAKDVVREKVTA